MNEWVLLVCNGEYSYYRYLTVSSNVPVPYMWEVGPDSGTREL